MPNNAYLWCFQALSQCLEYIARHTSTDFPAPSSYMSNSVHYWGYPMINLKNIIYIFEVSHAKTQDNLINVYYIFQVDTWDQTNIKSSNCKITFSGLDLWFWKSYINMLFLCCFLEFVQSSRNGHAKMYFTFFRSRGVLGSSDGSILPYTMRSM